MAFQRGVKREFTLFSSIFAPSLRPLTFTDQLIPFSSSVFFLRQSLLDLTVSSFLTHIHKHKLTCTPPSFPSPLSSLCLSTSYPSTALQPPSHPFPIPPPPTVKSTGGSSQHMYSLLLCGRHDNRHEFDMALTYPGGCEPVWMQSFKWRSRI